MSDVEHGTRGSLPTCNWLYQRSGLFKRNGLGLNNRQPPSPASQACGWCASAAAFTAPPGAVSLPTVRKWPAACARPAGRLSRVCAPMEPHARPSTAAAERVGAWIYQERHGAAQHVCSTALRS